ncbi:pirin family protein [Streptomyces sp. NPDC097619]|uniref:pirin family protein n=1 Tax=Streptomyces sp. NPDC097619 TaxID=3157228 RepID=UPI00332BE281
MIDVRRSGDRYRGGDPEAGITTRHAFSFGAFYDPDNIRFGPVLACNEEHLAPGAGFDEHPHSHTEIVTWVVEGELTHRDSTGQATVLRPGDLQRLSSASGVRHAERNEGTAPLRFVQMWLAPLEPGGDPSYEVVRALSGSGGGTDTGGAYPLPAAGAVLRVLRPAAGERVPVPAAARVYAHVVRGELLPEGPGAAPVGDGGGPLGPGDAARFTGPEGWALRAVTPGELLLWELP